MKVLSRFTTFIGDLSYVLWTHANQKPEALCPPETSPSSHETASPQAELEFAWRAFSNLNEWVRFSDMKAGAVLAANGIIVAKIATSLPGLHVANTYNQMYTAWIAAIIISTFYSVSHALMGLLPRLKTSEASSSLIFFADIVRDFPSSNTFVKAMKDALADPDRAVHEIACQVWSNSQIAVAKYANVTKSIRGLSWSIYLGFIGITIIAICQLSTGGN